MNYVYTHPYTLIYTYTQTDFLNYISWMEISIIVEGQYISLKTSPWRYMEGKHQRKM